MKLNSIKFAPRLGLGFGAVLLLAVAISAIGWTRLEMTQSAMVSTARIANRASQAERWMSLTELNVNRVLAIAKSADAPDVEAYFDGKIKATSTEISAIQTKLLEETTTQQAKAFLETIAQRRDAFVELRAAAMKRIKNNDPNAKAFVDDTLLKAADGYLAALRDLQQYESHAAKTLTEEANRDVDNSQNTLLWLTAACLVLASLIAWLITRSITLPLKRAVVATTAVASGDLTQAIVFDGKDEVEDLLRGLSVMQSTLKALVAQVRSSTDSVATASSQIAAGNLDLSGRTEDAASNLQQTAASMEQIASSVRQSVDSIRLVSELAATTADVAQKGGKMVSDVVSTMESIHASSSRITDIIGVIDSIAFQTNILALNAAVEAARAGDQGRGFAVVATEVRSLAQRSASAAKEIKTLISTSVEHVESGARLVGATGTTMQDIVKSSEKLSSLIQEVLLATSEQSRGVDEVNIAVTNMDQIAQQNSALVEESAAATQSLSGQAVTLSRIVSTFRIA
ncbi:MAG: HAMP domain-containing protein [Herminiimonas sp.]|nr:HAMP domain-containing protein [Herminiimonas sp.]